MKKILLITLLSFIIIFSLTGCGDDDTDTNTNNNNDSSTTNSAYEAEMSTTTEGFTFVLTPTIMKQIRKYNSERTYADFTLTCYDYDSDSELGYHCYSTFLTCLAGGNYTTTKCTAIFGTTLKGYSNVSSYDEEDLNTSREKLIKKQNALDEELFREREGS